MSQGLPPFYVHVHLLWDKVFLVKATEFRIWKHAGCDQGDEGSSYSPNRHLQAGSWALPAYKQCCYPSVDAEVVYSGNNSFLTTWLVCVGCFLGKIA